MSNRLKKDDLKEFVVQIEYQKEMDIREKASGVIVRVDDSLVYILTVKHILNKKSNIPISKIDENIDIQKFTIKNYRAEKIEIEKIFFVKNKDLDILILKVNSSLKTKKLEIYQDEFHQCAIFGYPRSREKTYNSLVLPASYPDKIDFDDNSFEVRADIPLKSFDKSERDNIKGLSGSGVFIKGKSGKIYLIGIQYAYMDIICLKSLNLRVVKKDIDEVIKGELPIAEYPFFEELGIDIDKITFNSLEEYFTSKDINKFKKNIFKNSTKAVKKLEEEYIFLKENMKILADKYFLLGKKAFEENELSRAYGYFSRAIELYPTYKHFFAKKEFAKNSLTEKQQEARDNLDKELPLNSYLLETIIESEKNFFTKEKDYEGLEKLYLKLIKFSSNSKEKIINLLLKLSTFKLKNNKPIEAENILYSIREETDNISLKSKIDKELIEIYQFYIDTDFISENEIIKKLIILENRLEDKDKSSVTYILNQLKINNYDFNDCFVEHMEHQRKAIASLKHENSRLRFENENCYKQIEHQASYILEVPKEKSNTKFLFIGFLVGAVLVIILILEYLNCPALKWIESLDLNFFRKIFHK